MMCTLVNPMWLYSPTNIENCSSKLPQFGLVHSPKWHLEFVNLTDMMETHGLKMLCNVKTRWISLLESLKKVLSKYHIILAKMAQDMTTNTSVEGFHYLFFGFGGYLVCFFHSIPCLFRLLKGVDLFLLCCKWPTKEF